MPSITFCIVGSRHYKGADDCIRRLGPGSRLELRREPRNQFDKNAVEVYYGGQKLGYVPRADAFTVSTAIQQELLESAVMGLPPTMTVHWMTPKTRRAKLKDEAAAAAAAADAEERYVEAGSDILA